MCGEHLQDFYTVNLTRFRNCKIALLLRPQGKQINTCRQVTLQKCRHLGFGVFIVIWSMSSAVSLNSFETHTLSPDHMGIHDRVRLTIFPLAGKKTATVLLFFSTVPLKFFADTHPEPGPHGLHCGVHLMTVPLAGKKTATVLPFFFNSLFKFFSQTHTLSPDHMGFTAEYIS